MRHESSDFQYEAAEYTGELYLAGIEGPEILKYKY